MIKEDVQFTIARYVFCASMSITFLTFFVKNVCIGGAGVVMWSSWVSQFIITIALSLVARARSIHSRGRRAAGDKRRARIAYDGL